MSVKEKNKIRLYVDAPLVVGETLLLPSESSHYLCNVMRLAADEVISCFNGRDGEFDCVIRLPHKKQTALEVDKQTRPFQASPDIWLLFAPVKKDKTDFIIEKATELGCRKICPVVTERTVVDKVRADRYAAQAIEAAEQCRRVDVPALGEACPLRKVLTEWDTARLLFFMDETGRGRPAVEAFRSSEKAPAAVLVGPEGGFSAAELDLLYGLPYARAVSLGSRILRAETAVAAALSVWQAVAGDWQ